MAWEKIELYVFKDRNGVVVRISEKMPSEYSFAQSQAVREAYRASEEPSKRITEYARRKIAEKKKRMGGD